jgi:peptidyl-tRNA hydrolase
MNTGKAIAQVNHAGTQFINSYIRDNGIQNIKVKEWLNEANGFGTVIILSGSIEDIRTFYTAMMLMDIPCGFIKDPTYPFILDKELVKLLINNNIMEELKQKCDFQYLEEDLTNNETTKVHCTRNEETCAWFFVEDDFVEEFKEYCESGNIQLHE